MGIENEYVKKSEVLDQIDQWLDSGEYHYSNATHYLKKRVSEIRDDSWISVANRLPELNTWVLVYAKFLVPVFEMERGIRKTGDVYKAFYDGRFSKHGDMVTHWKPLPEKPKE